MWGPLAEEVCAYGFDGFDGFYGFYGFCGLLLGGETAGGEHNAGGNLKRNLQRARRCGLAGRRPRSRACSIEAHDACMIAVMA